ncbi:MAG: hypothetical protein K2F81_04160 [Ruminococcus sp.]|nr:hypothetical protein [Ruminococcus sp.]
MLKLTHDNFLKARDYIFIHSDDINRAWFIYNFEDKNTDKFMKVLSKYQYENGGFGGLFYEFDYQGPCLKSTEIAIKYIFALKEKPSAYHPVIQNMMKYILERYHPEIGNWGDVAEPEVNDGVYCCWTRYRGDAITPIENEDERIKLYDANEKVCFAAFVAYYSELVPDELYLDIVKYPIQHILRYWDINSPIYNKNIFDDGTPYNFEYFQWFVPCLKDKKIANKLTSILCQNPTAFMELDYTKSDNDYVHLPCDAINSPDNIIYSTVKKLVDDSLEYRIKQQSDDGRWPLGWSFGEDDGLCKLQVLYEAYLTLGMLVKLERFGRIEK